MHASEWRTRTGPVRSSRDPILLVALCAPILGASIFSRFSVPPFADLGISIALPLILAALAVAAITGRLQIEPRRLAFFCLMLGGLALPHLLSTRPFSLTSLLMLLVLHLPYVLVATDGQSHAEQVLRFFLGVALLLACLAIAQFSLQLVMPPNVLFPVDSFTPPQFLTQGFNSQGTVRYGLDLYRANGVFMLEPSYLTQFLAVAIIAEVMTFKRVLPLAVYAVATVVAYSGTGLIVLMVCLPLVVILYRRWDLLLIGAAALLVFAAAADVLHLDLLTSRSSEFENPESSAYARFVGGFDTFEQMLWGDPLRALFGYGPGAFLDRVHLFHNETAEMPLFKMVFEFGVVGAALYFAFLIYCCFASVQLPFPARFAIFLTFLLNGLYVPFSHGLALSLLTLVSLKSTAGRRARKPARTDTDALPHPQVRMEMPS